MIKSIRKLLIVPAIAIAFVSFVLLSIAIMLIVIAYVLRELAGVKQ